MFSEIGSNMISSAANGLTNVVPLFENAGRLQNGTGRCVRRLGVSSCGHGSPTSHETVNFAHPERLWLLAILVPLWIWEIRGRRLRRRVWQAVAQRGRPPGTGVLFVTGSVICLIVALGQPRWGRLAGPALAPGHDVVLMVDVSRSMAAEDAVPNRLGAAIEDAESLVTALARGPANRAAVVAFAGRGVLRCPLTENLGAVLDALHRLRPGALRPGGTDLGAALDEAIEVFDPEKHAQGRAIVIFSDGEDHGNRWDSRIQRLREEELVVHAVAIGDPDEGHPVPGGGASGPIEYHGAPVMSRRSDTAMETIAEATGGTIVKLGLASVDLGKMYETKIEPLARRRRAAGPLAERTERFPLLLLGALFFLLAGCRPVNGYGSLTWLWAWNWRRPAQGSGCDWPGTGRGGPGHRRRRGTSANGEATGS